MDWHPPDGQTPEPIRGLSVRTPTAPEVATASVSERHASEIAREFVRPPVHSASTPNQSADRGLHTQAGSLHTPPLAPHPAGGSCMRFASLTLVLLAACSSGTPQAGVDRLIGTWAHIAVLPGCVERRPEQWVNEITAYVEKEGEEATETFLPDGTWINRHQATSGVQPRWSLIEQDHERITVAIDAPIANGGRITRSFVFESPDLMREEHSRYAGMKLARVPPPK